MDDFGLTKNEIVGNRCYTLFQNLEKPCSSFGDYCPIDEAIKTNGTSTKSSLLYETYDRKKFIETSAHPIKAGNGRTTEFVVVTKETSEKKTSNELGDTIIQLMNESLIIEDHGGSISYINPKAEKMLGYKKEELLGEHWMKIVSPTCRERIKKTPDNGGLMTYEAVLMSKEGKEVPVIVNSTLVFEGKTFTGAISVITDITKMKRSKEKLKNAYEKLKTLDKMKSDIISNVSHELLTPLTIFKGVTDLVYDEEDLDERAKLLKIGRRAIDRQFRVIRDLTEVANINKNKNKITHKFDPMPLDLREVVENAVDENLYFALKNDVKVEVSIPQTFPMPVGEPLLLCHAISNMMNNAIKFNKKGGRVFVFAKHREGDVEVNIQDTGIGIARRYLDKIFDKLYQIDATTTRTYEGTGMGLVVAKEIIGLHGSRIEVESEPEKGSTFRFTLKTAGSAAGSQSKYS